MQHDGTAEPPQRKAMASTLYELGRLARFGELDDEALAASLNQLAQLGAAIDIDSLHVPEDAGEYRARLVALMLRIPDGWGRWISCDAGWYPLITELDANLGALDPDYVIEQVKEKFGTLRFYAAGERAVRFDALIAAAEEASAYVCERCGASPAQICSTGQSYRRCKTLCAACCERASRSA